MNSFTIKYDLIANILCPICRTINPHSNQFISSNTHAKECIICKESDKKFVWFPTCYHFDVCSDCVKNIYIEHNYDIHNDVNDDLISINSNSSNDGSNDDFNGFIFHNPESNEDHNVNDSGLGSSSYSSSYSDSSSDSDSSSESDSSSGSDSEPSSKNLISHDILNHIDNNHNHNHNHNDENKIDTAFSSLLIYAEQFDYCMNLSNDINN